MANLIYEHANGTIERHSIKQLPFASLDADAEAARIAADRQRDKQIATQAAYEAFNKRKVNADTLVRKALKRLLVDDLAPRFADAESIDDRIAEFAADEPRAYAVLALERVGAAADAARNLVEAPDVPLVGQAAEALKSELLRQAERKAH